LTGIAFTFSDLIQIAQQYARNSPRTGAKCGADISEEYLGESDYLLVFVKTKAASRREWHVAWNGGFCSSVLGGKITKGNAIFVAKPSYKTLLGTQVYELCSKAI
jgi:hypothetical protein